MLITVILILIAILAFATGLNVLGKVAQKAFDPKTRLPVAIRALIILIITIGILAILYRLSGLDSIF